MNNNGIPTSFKDRLNDFTKNQLKCQSVPAAFHANDLMLTGEDIPFHPGHNRMDLRSLPCFTIDCDDTKDMDDAVSLTFADGIYHLGVHIADVSAYVTPGSHPDNLAVERGTSIYLPNMTIPMLPPVLSENLCSLSEGADRYTISVLMELDTRGCLLSSRIVKSRICSRIKGTYSEVNALLRGDPSPKVCTKYQLVSDSLAGMHALSSLLRTRRILSGAVVSDDLKPKILLRNDDIQLIPADPGPAQHMIEEFMVLANTVVAEYFRDNCLPCIFRTQRMLDTLAEYQSLPCCHKSLALENYSHFTSPIRRLADLKTHQVLSAHLEGCPSELLCDLFGEMMRECSMISTKRNHRAQGLQKCITGYCYREYFARHDLQKFSGVVSGYNNNGCPCFTLNELNILVVGKNKTPQPIGTRVSMNVRAGSKGLTACNLTAA